MIRKSIVALSLLIAPVLSIAQSSHESGAAFSYIFGLSVSSDQNTMAAYASDSKADGAYIVGVPVIISPENS